MHEVFHHLAGRVGEAQAALEKVRTEVEAQVGREVKLLEQAAYGEEFDAELAPVQEEVVAAMQEALEALEEAWEQVERARTRIGEIPEL